MEKGNLGFILKMAQTINPQIYPGRELDINLLELRQLPEGTLGREVARFFDDNGFEPLKSGDWIQRTHDIWHVVTGLSPSKNDEFILQAFTRSQVFRPSSAILVLAGLLIHRCNLKEIIHAIKNGKMAKDLIDWDIESDWATPLNEVREKLGVIASVPYKNTRS
ncbi:Coq4 family protein [Rivularia sp. UHCC 0363]|uniref:Coq4 family protein n=1 Tax=Rivularia sp. UHCC 0363 TaxID=3110244 RepID=UPI002B207828|nr:Coq4 family protein [Rivularia sp. UHCC 0363]MEA5596349.1 Coq4 family protein [Rivularia sp. UHCC 0363]